VRCSRDWMAHCFDTRGMGEWVASSVCALAVLEAQMSVYVCGPVRSTYRACRDTRRSTTLPLTL
jgi:hypothetical protein